MTSLPNMRSLILRRRRSGTGLVALASALLLGFGFIIHGFAAEWPSWRGPAGNGTSAETNVPIHWSTTENVRWRVSLPERGNSSPIVWQDRVFITQALEKEQRRTVMCFDRASGKLLWQSGTTYTAEEESHETNPYASASPVTDGERVIAWFGSAGIFCYDMEGKEIWKRDLGKQQHGFGYGASPIIYGDLCILNFGPGERSFLIALEKKTGKTVWQVDVPTNQSEYEGPVGTFSTPIIVQVEGRDELVTTFPSRVVGLDPFSGKELWSCGRLDQQVLSSPVAGEGVVAAMGGFKGNSVAVKLGGKGDVTESHRLWRNKNTLLPTGVIHEGHYYGLKSNGVAICLNLLTGETVWSERLKSSEANNGSWSSIVLVDGRLYIPNQSGVTFVLKAAPKFELLATNSIGNEMNNSSIAVAHGSLFLRTHMHLWCFGGVEG